MDLIINYTEVITMQITVLDVLNATWIWLDKLRRI